MTKNLSPPKISPELKKFLPRFFFYITVPSGFFLNKKKSGYFSPEKKFFISITKPIKTQAIQNLEKKIAPTAPLFRELFTGVYFC
jgi:hypothetical protein